MPGVTQLKRAQVPKRMDYFKDRPGSGEELGEGLLFRVLGERTSAGQGNVVPADMSQCLLLSTWWQLLSPSPGPARLMGNPMPQTGAWGERGLSSGQEVERWALCSQRGFSSPGGRRHGTGPRREGAGSASKGEECAGLFWSEAEVLQELRGLLFWFLSWSGIFAYGTQ